MVQIKLNEMSENANKSERFHTNNAAPATLRAEAAFRTPAHLAKI